MNGSVLDAPRIDPPIDRRLRARRIDVQRREGRRRLRRLLLVIGFSVLALAAWGTTRSPLLDIDAIEVVGASHTPSADVIASTEISLGDPLTDVDLDGAAIRVASLPWIDTAEVTRSWGGSVAVEVTERVPVVVLRDDAGVGWLVDSSGTVIASATDVDPAVSADLPVVVGLDPPSPGDAVDPSPSVVLSLASALPRDVPGQVSLVEVDPAGEIWLWLAPRPGEVAADGSPRTDGGRIRLGDGRDLPDQLVSLATVLARVDLTDLEVADFRVADNPVVVSRVVPNSAVPDEDAVE